MLTNLRTVTPVTDESVGAEVARRRIALGYDRVELADKAGVHRNTLAKLELGDPSVSAVTTQKVLAAITRLERLHGADEPEEIVNVLEVDLGDGRTARATFTGSPEGVAEAVAQLVRKLESKD